MLISPSGAKFSECNNYRYAIWRLWDEALPTVMFVSLNPSIADHKREDPTLIRCINFARSWGYGSLSIGNLFAGISSDPKNMRLMPDPVGKDNDFWLQKMAGIADLKVAAWGNHGNHLNRASEVFEMLTPMFCIKINKSGQPSHPLYLRASLKPKLFKRLSIAI